MGSAGVCSYPEEYLKRLRFYEKNYVEEKIKINSVDIKIEGYCKEVNTIKDLLLTFQLLTTGDNTKCSTRLLYDAGFEGVPEYVQTDFKGSRSQVRGLVNFLKSGYGEPKTQSGPTFFQKMIGFHDIEEPEKTSDDIPPGPYHFWR